MISKNQIFTLLVLVTTLLSCKDSDDAQNSIETEPIVFTKEAELYLIKSEGDTLKKIDVEFADSDYERQTGLMYRRTMEEDQGMLFIYNTEAPRSFFMKNTYIPLDLIFYDADSTAVSFHENAEPLNEDNLPSGEPAQYVLEINAGLVEKWDIQTGDTFSVINRENNPQ